LPRIASEIFHELMSRYNQTLSPVDVPVPPGSAWGWSRTAPMVSCSQNQRWFRRSVMLSTLDCVPHQVSCSQNQRWFRRSVMGFAVLFSYVNFLPIPWRISILVH